MQYIWITALGVGGATMIGALIGFLFKRIPHRYHDGIMGFASGVMLAAAMIGLILPSIQLVKVEDIWIIILGIFSGAVFLNLMDNFTPHLHRLSGVDQEEHKHNKELNKVLLFVFAIALHNLPEGIAAGVGFAQENVADAITVAIGIIIQNIPEGMVIIAPMLAAGISKKRTFLIAACTGLIEVIGTFLGFASASLSQSILPFALAFAGGTMLYVVCDEMIPDTHAHGYERLATYSMILGVVVMLLIDALL